MSQGKGRLRCYGSDAPGWGERSRGRSKGRFASCSICVLKHHELFRLAEGEGQSRQKEQQKARGSRDQTHSGDGRRGAWLDGGCEAGISWEDEAGGPG